MAGFPGFFFWLLKDVGLTGWDVVRGSCRDAGKCNGYSYAAGGGKLTLALVLWNMLQGSKLSRPSTLSATRTSWADSSMSERYVNIVGELYLCQKLREVIGSRSRTPFHGTSSWRSRRIRRWTSRWIWRWIRGWRDGCRRRRWQWWSSNLRLQRLFPIHSFLLSICVELSC